MEIIKPLLYYGQDSKYSPRTCSRGRPAGDTLCPRPRTSEHGLIWVSVRLVSHFALQESKYLPVARCCGKGAIVRASRAAALLCGYRSTSTQHHQPSSTHQALEGNALTRRPHTIYVLSTTPKVGCVPRDRFTSRVVTRATVLILGGMSNEDVNIPQVSLYGCRYHTRTRATLYPHGDGNILGFGFSLCLASHPFHCGVASHN